MEGQDACNKSIISKELDVDREEFCRRIQEAYRNKKGTNTFLLTPEKYAQVIEQVKAATLAVKKTAADYRRLKRYVVVDTPIGERLYGIPKGNQKPQQMFVNTQEMYDIIRECHLKYSHGGRNRIMVALKPKYKNITTESILVYLQMCLPCKNKLVGKRGKGPKSTEETLDSDPTSLDDIDDNFDDDDPLQTEMGIQMEPEMKSEEVNLQQNHPELYSRGQVDILDVTTEPNEEYKYMMVYRDFPNKYIHLKPLKAVSVDETADALLEVFLIFGAPNILQSKNGISIITPVCRRVCALCPDIKIVPGDAVFSKNDFMGKSNEDILKLLNKWLEESQSTKWQQGLKYVQHSLNTSFDVAICRTPSELIFGRNPRNGLASFMSKDEYDCLMTEEDLKTHLGGNGNRRRSKQLKLKESLVLPCNFIKMEVETLDGTADDDNE